MRKGEERKIHSANKSRMSAIQALFTQLETDPRPNYTWYQLCLSEAGARSADFRRLRRHMEKQFSIAHPEPFPRKAFGTESEDGRTHKIMFHTPGNIWFDYTAPNGESKKIDWTSTGQMDFVGTNIEDNKVVGLLIKTSRDAIGKDF